MADVLLEANSTLTDRYQTTVPEPVRRALHLTRRDRIHYQVLTNGDVLMSRAKAVAHDDPVITDFLAFLEKDMQANPRQLLAVDAELVKNLQALVKGVEVDLDAPLSAADDDF